MPAKTIDVRSAPPDWGDLVAWVQEGEEVLLVDGETPLARIVPTEPRPARLAGLQAGQIWTGADFDDPLPNAYWSGEA